MTDCGGLEFNFHFFSRERRRARRSERQFCSTGGSTCYGLSGLVSRVFIQQSPEEMAISQQTLLTKTSELQDRSLAILGLNKEEIDDLG